MGWPTVQSAWTEDRVKRAKALLESGLSYTQIARALGGVSRNGVLGKMHRMGFGGPRSPNALTASPKPGRRAEFTELAAPAELPDVVARRETLEKAVMPDEPVVLEDGQHVTMLTVNDRTCRWPIGEPGDPGFHFCGHSPFEGSPYCAAHYEKAHQPHGNTLLAKDIAREKQQRSTVWR